MDVYLNVDWEKCVRCGLCVEACGGALMGRRNKSPSSACDPMPCRGCEEDCKKACYYKAISWSRY